MSREMCLFWWRSALASTILFSFLSTCFCILAGTTLLFLAALPNAIFKPFGLYVVGGFLSDMYNQRVGRLRPLSAFELDMTEEDCVDSAGPSRPPRKHDPPSASSSEGDTYKLFTSTEPQLHEDTKIGVTVAGGDASLVQDILHEKFNMPTKASVVGRASKSKPVTLN